VRALAAVPGACGVVEEAVRLVDRSRTHRAERGQGRE
jgi:hypothetical protein